MEVSEENFIFWSILEEEMHSKIPHHIKNAFSFNTFGNALTFSEITIDDIKQIQKYVKEDLPSILSEALNESGAVYNTKQKSWFFGPFAAKPETFYITCGEMKLLNQAILKVKEILNDPAKGVQYFHKQQLDSKKNVISYEHSMCDSVFGLVFGDTREIKKNETARTIDEYSKKLFCKAKPMLDKYETDERLHIRAFSMDSVEVTINSKGIPRGKVSCCFCHESNLSGIVSVSYRGSLTNGSWIMSNLDGHIIRYHVNALPVSKRRKELKVKMENACNSLKDRPAVNDSSANSLGGDTKQPKKKERPGTSKSSNQSNKENVSTTIELKIEAINEDSESDDDQSQEDILITQMKQQIIRMSNAAIANNENTIEITLGNKGKGQKSWKMIKICKIPSDGDCLLSSIVHQLYGLEINSEEHNQKTIEIRKEITDYILLHITDFVHELKGRIYEKNGSKRIEDAELEIECTNFVKNVLSKRHQWGGSETIKAVSRIYNLNVIILNDDGTSNISYKLNSKCTRTLIVFYNGGKERNHYDSVIGISDTKINEISKSIILTETKQNEIHDVSHISIS